MLDTPQIVHTADQPTAVIRLTVPRSEIQHVMGPGITEVMAAVAAQGITPTGPWFTHHLRMDPAIFDFEISVPVPRPITAAGRVTPGLLPAAKVARTVYRGAQPAAARLRGRSASALDVRAPSADHRQDVRRRVAGTTSRLSGALPWRCRHTYGACARRWERSC